MLLAKAIWSIASSRGNHIQVFFSLPNVLHRTIQGQVFFSLPILLWLSTPNYTGQYTECCLPKLSDPLLHPGAITSKCSSASLSSFDFQPKLHRTIHRMLLAKAIWSIASSRGNHIQVFFSLPILLWLSTPNYTGQYTECCLPKLSDPLLHPGAITSKCSSASLSSFDFQPQTTQDNTQNAACQSYLIHCFIQGQSHPSVLQPPYPPLTFNPKLHRTIHRMLLAKAIWSIASSRGNHIQVFFSLPIPFEAMDQKLWQSILCIVLVVWGWKSWRTLGCDCPKYTDNTQNAACQSYLIHCFIWGWKSKEDREAEEHLDVIAPKINGSDSFGKQHSVYCPV